MPRKYVKRTRRPRSTTRKPAKRSNRGYVTKAQVNRMINREVEDKVFYQFPFDPVSISNVLPPLAPFFNNLNYQVLQGTGQGDRVGNKVTHKAGTLKCSLNVRPYNALSNSRQIPQLVTLVVFKIRGYQTGVNPTYANFFSKMFQLGNTSQPLTNTPIDHIRPFNKDIMDVKAVRRFKMGMSERVDNSPAAGAYIAPNNDFDVQKFVSINLTKFYKKTQIFNDGIAPNDAQNDNLFFMVYCCPMDGSAYTSTPIDLTWDLQLKYQDA